MHPVYWVCRTDAAEQASILEFASRMAGRPFDTIDATGLDVLTREGVRARTPRARLRSEDAPLRILRDGRLVSAPPTHYDDALGFQAAAEWEVAARLIGRTLHHLAVAADPPERGAGDISLSGRVQALGDFGRLDIRGAGPGLRGSEVRRPAAPPRA